MIKSLTEHLMAENCWCHDYHSLVAMEIK